MDKGSELKKIRQNSQISSGQWSQISIEKGVKYQWTMKVRKNKHRISPRIDCIASRKELDESPDYKFKCTMKVP